MRTVKLVHKVDLAQCLVLSKHLISYTHKSSLLFPFLLPHSHAVGKEEQTMRIFLEYLLSAIPAFSSVHLFRRLCLDYCRIWA